MDPTESDLRSPAFQAIWNAIKFWDICRVSTAGYSHATGTDVMAILTALRGAGLVVENLVDDVGKLDAKTVDERT